MNNTIDRIDFAKIAAREHDAEQFRAECMSRNRIIKPFGGSLLSPGSANVKLRKSGREELRIVSLSLAHGSAKVCPSSTEDCRKFCVGGTGLANVWPTIQASRQKKTEFVLDNRQAAVTQIVGELEDERRQAERDGALLIARLNCFSDIPWESKPWGMIPQLFISCGVRGAGAVLFYDYTAILSRVSDPQRPANYALCGSWKGTPKNIAGCHELLMSGHNVSVPFAVEGAYSGNRALFQPIPSMFRILGDTFHVVDGDETDLRCFDPGVQSDGRGNVIGLRFKSSSNERRREGLNSVFTVKDDEL